MENKKYINDFKEQKDNLIKELKQIIKLNEKRIVNNLKSKQYYAMNKEKIKLRQRNNKLLFPQKFKDYNNYYYKFFRKFDPNYIIYRKMYNEKSYIHRQPQIIHKAPIKVIIHFDNLSVEI